MDLSSQRRCHCHTLMNDGKSMDEMIDILDKERKKLNKKTLMLM